MRTYKIKFLNGVEYQETFIISKDKLEALPKAREKIEEITGQKPSVLILKELAVPMEESKI